jgi:hypothetical protein
VANELTSLVELIEAARRGRVKLPAGWLSEYRAWERVDAVQKHAAARARTPAAGMAQRTASEDLVATARAGAIPELATIAGGVVEVERQDREAVIGSAIVGGARDTLGRAVLDLVADEAEEWLSSTLVTAMSEVVAGVQKIISSGALDGIDLSSPSSVLHGGKGVADAYGKLEELGRRYRGLRACQVTIAKLSGRKLGQYAFAERPRKVAEGETSLDRLLADVAAGARIATVEQEQASEAELAAARRKAAPVPRIKSMTLTGVG